MQQTPEETVIIQIPKFRPVKFHQLTQGDLVGHFTGPNSQPEVYQVRFLWYQNGRNSKFVTLILASQPERGRYKRLYTRKEFNAAKFVLVGLIQTDLQGRLKNATNI